MPEPARHARAALRTGPLIDSGVPVELPARRKDGTEFWIEVSLSPFEAADAASRLVLAIVRDVTPRKLAEAVHLERIRAAEAGWLDGPSRDHR